MKINPNPIKSPNTRESLHGWVIPPCCRAIRRQIVEARRRQAPAQSIVLSRWRIESCCFSCGGRTQRATTAMMIAPGGRKT